MGTVVVGNTKGIGLGKCAATDPPFGFDHDKAQAILGALVCRCDPGSPSADNHHIRVGCIAQASKGRRANQGTTQRDLEASSRQVWTR